MSVIDQFKEFKQHYSANNTFESWLKSMENFNALKDLCVHAYDDWKTIAKTRVFIYDDAVFKRMVKAHDMILSSRPKVVSALSQFFSLDLNDIQWVIAHGLGNGAGWALVFEGNPTVFLGVEKIVALGWDNPRRIDDLMTHELMHLVHASKRDIAFKHITEFKAEYLLRMYVEGVATYGEGLFHGRQKTMPSWITQCHQKEKLLKQKMLHYLNTNDQRINDLFGDWYPVYGIHEAAYYLGLRLIQTLLASMSIETVLVLDEKTIIKQAIHYLSS